MTKEPKVLTFFNYSKAVATLQSQLLTVELKYKTLITTHTGLISEEDSLAVQVPIQLNRPEPHEDSGRKRLVLIDQNKVIESLRDKIVLYETKIEKLGIQIKMLIPEDPTKSIQTDPSNASFPIRINQPYITNMSVLGWLPDGDGQMIANMLDQHSQIGPFVQSAGIIGSEFKSAMVSDAYKLMIWFNGEQTSQDILTFHTLKSHNLLLIFFDLNALNTAKESYSVSKRRIRVHHLGKGKMIVMLGLHKPGIQDKDSLDLFHRFREEECIDLYFICEESREGKDLLRIFLTAQLANLSNSLEHPYRQKIATNYAHRSSAYYRDSKLYDCLKWADLALKEDPLIFSREDKLPLPERISLLKVISTDFTFDINSLIKGSHQNKTSSQNISILKMLSNRRNLDYGEFIDKTHVDYTKFVYSKTSDDLHKESLIDQSDTYHTTIHFSEYFIFNKQSSDFVESTSSHSFRAKLLDFPNEPILHIATRLGFRRLVKWLISEGTDVNIRSEDGRTAIMIAVFHGDHDLVANLLEEGADITLETQHRTTCLSLAAKCNLTKGIGYLVDRYKDRNLLIKHINEALIPAIIYNNLSTLKELLSYGGNVHHQDTQGRSLLTIATESNPEIAQYLLEKYPNEADKTKCAMM